MVRDKPDEKNPKFKENDKVKDGTRGLFKGQKGSVKKVDIDPKANRRRYLVEGTGLKGATKVEGVCKECKQKKISAIPNLRYYYEFMLEVDN